MYCFLQQTLQKYCYQRPKKTNNSLRSSSLTFKKNVSGHIQALVIKSDRYAVSHSSPLYTSRRKLIQNNPFNVNSIKLPKIQFGLEFIPVPWCSEELQKLYINLLPTARGSMWDNVLCHLVKCQSWIHRENPQYLKGLFFLCIF